MQKAKARGTPALYFTNLISARPLMGPAGAGSLAQVVNAAIAGKSRMDEMRAFFEGDLRWLRHYGFAALDMPDLAGGLSR